MLKVLVKAIGTDLFLKVIRIDVEVADESRTESFVRFEPFDDAKKPTADDMNSLVAETKHAAVQNFRKKQVFELARLIENCQIGVGEVETDTADAVQPEAPTAPAVETKPEPVAQPAPVKTEEPKKRGRPFRHTAETPAAPVKAEVTNPEPVKVEAPKVEQAPVAAPVVAPAPTTQPIATPAVDAPIGPQYDEEGLDDDPTVVLDLRNQKHMQAIRDTLAGFYGPSWNTDKTAPGYIKVTAHLKSLQGTPFFCGEELSIAPSILEGFTEILDSHFTRAEPGCV